MEFEFSPELFDDLDLSFLDTTTNSSQGSFLNDASRWGFSEIHDSHNPTRTSSSSKKKKRSSPNKQNQCNKTDKKTAKKKQKRRKSAEDDVDTVESTCIPREEGELDDTEYRPVDVEDEWNYRDSSVNSKVLKYFPVNGLLTEFVGQVIAYLPSSTTHANDQLYKIKYPEDSDVEDMEQAEYEVARELMRAKYAPK